MRRLIGMTAMTVLWAAATSISQQTTTEAGKYQRKSVTYVNALWLMDPTVKGLPSEKVAMVLQKTKEALFMRRFDYNPVPENFTTDFVNQINAMSFPPTLPADEFSAALPHSGPDPMLDSVASVMERTIVPKILEVVDANKELRAAALTTEEQRNSFIADKAKTLGITMDDIQKVMNSAYIFIPLIRAYHAAQKDSSYSVGFDAGIIWFKISAQGDKAKAIPVVRQFTHSLGFSSIHRTYPTTDGMLDFKEFAFRSAVKNAVRNLVTATQEIPDFRLSGQIVENSALGASFDIGKNEGVHVDDKYHMVELVEQADGSVTQHKNGWVMVTSVGDSSSKKGYKSRARIISGKAYTGEVLTEYPRLPIDVIFKGRMFTFTTANDTARDSVFDSLSLAGNWGGGIDVQYDLGRHIGLPQFFFDLGFGIGYFGPTGGKGHLPGDTTRIPVKSAMNMNFELSLVKKVYIRRVALMLQAMYSWQYLDLRSDPLADTVYSWTTASIGNGLTVNAGLEIALGPAANLGVCAGYQYMPNTNLWTIQQKVGQGKWATVDGGSALTGTNVIHTGIVAQVYLTWSVPALAFDPIDMVRGVAGL
jgi:hypothetical protein